jgi:hypothetical protein
MTRTLPLNVLQPNSNLRWRPRRFPGVDLRDYYGSLVPLPEQSPEQRAAALEKAAEARRVQAEIKELLRTGTITFGEVLTRAETESMIGGLKLKSVLESLPGLGKIKTKRLLESLDIDGSRRLRGLGDRQRRALMTELG